MTVRKIRVGKIEIGGRLPVVLQSMCATKTADVSATAAMVERLSAAGAGVVRIAVDTENDVQALAEIRRRTTANLSVDLQENYLLASEVAKYVDKIRYNPGHLHHRSSEKSWEEKVRFLARVASDNDVALRVGVNCGSIEPARIAAMKSGDEPFDPILASALSHADYLESLGFLRFCVSIKDSDPDTVIAVNRRFRQLRPAIPLHLGVTEAGLPPMGILKSRRAMEPLLAEGIGETLRVSLTVESENKAEELAAGRVLLANVAAGRIFDPVQEPFPKLNIVSCPSCSRVENADFVSLARRVERATRFAADWPLTIAVMGCRVNGPGETNDADFGLWCGAGRVNFKAKGETLGSWPYDEITDILVERIKKYAEENRFDG